MLTLRRVVVVGAASAALILTGCGGDDGGGSDSFCDLANDANDSNSKLSEIVNGDPDPDELSETFDELIDQAENAIDKADDDAKPTLEESVRLYKEFREILKDNDYDFAAAVGDPAYSDIGEDLASSGDAVDEYLSEECNIDDSDDSGAPSPTGGFDSGAAEDAQVEAITSFFPNLSEDKARCLVQAGMDITGIAGDPSAFLETLRDCDVEASDLER